MGRRSVSPTATNAVVWIPQEDVDTVHAELLASRLETAEAAALIDIAERGLSSDKLFSGRYAVIPAIQVPTPRKGARLSVLDVRAALSKEPGEFDVVHFDTTDLDHAVAKKVVDRDLPEETAAARAKIMNLGTNLSEEAYGVTKTKSTEWEVAESLRAARALEVMILSKPDVGPVTLIDPETGAARHSYSGNGALYRATIEATDDGLGTLIVRGPAPEGEGQSLIGFSPRHVRDFEKRAFDLEPDDHHGNTVALLGEGLTEAMLPELKGALEYMSGRRRYYDGSGHLRTAVVSDAFARTFREKAEGDEDGAVFTAGERGRYHTGRGSALKALESAESEAALVRIETTREVAKSIDENTPIRLSYLDYPILKRVYIRDSEKIVYGVHVSFYGTSRADAVSMVFGSKAAAEKVAAIAGAQTSVIEAPLGKFLPPLALGTGEGRVILDPFHK